MRIMVALLGLGLVAASAPLARAQSLGTFSWQLEPYCNIVTFTVTGEGPAYRLTGFDNQCGAGRTPLAGVATPNADGTMTLAFYLIGATGHAGHTSATLSPGSYSGPWRDDGGLSGTLRFGATGAPTGSPRPLAEFQRRVAGQCAGSEFVQKVREDGSVECGAAPAGGGGDITAVTAGAGLTGGGANGDVTLGLATGGVGSAQIADGSIGAIDVNTAEIQHRLTSSCAAGVFLTGINATGAPICGDGAITNTAVALGAGALAVNAGTHNAAVGANALLANTIGSYNTAVGSQSLEASTTGTSNVGVGFRALHLNTTGSTNVAIGSQAMQQNESGGLNVAIGWNAMAMNSTGLSNVAIGSSAMNENVTGANNTAVGSAALPGNTTGARNVAVGLRAMMRATAGDENVAIGADALRNLTTGSGNVVIGEFAGNLLTTGGGNIIIGTGGTADESATIRLGSASHTRAFMGGIRGRITGNANAVAVVVDSAGQLGTVSSSRRTKEDIHDMGDASAGLFRLRPVTFRYITPYADGSTPTDYGLIAEEVAEVYPDLVVRNDGGEVETVQYHKLVPMLLNELQRQQRAIAQLRATVEALAVGLDRRESRPR